MKLAPALLSVAVLLIGTIAPGVAAPKSFKQDVITAVSHGHITITRKQLVAEKGGKNKEVPVHTTYIIDSFTRAEINGKRDEVRNLQEGMLVSVTGDLNTSKNERTARLIIARDRPVPSVVKKPRPAKVDGTKQ